MTCPTCGGDNREGASFCDAFATWTVMNTSFTPHHLAERILSEEMRSAANVGR